jgi:hypothetical protein
MPNSTLILAKRSLKLNKVNSGMGIFLAAIGIFAFDVLPFFYFDALAVLVLLAVPFMVLGIFLFSTPVSLLYVYDKNNGVLEYLISLGWNQGDIFKRYLKAALLSGLILFIVELSITMIVDIFAGAQAYILHDLAWLTLIAGFGLSVVSFVTMAMIAFSSLQRPVGGNANQPLALSLGGLLIIPTFYIQAFSYDVAVLVDLAIPILAGAGSILLLVLSSRLIRREKMLP